MGKQFMVHLMIDIADRSAQGAGVLIFPVLESMRSHSPLHTLISQRSGAVSAAAAFLLVTPIITAPFSFIF
jgi:hypothetical protein